MIPVEVHSELKPLIPGFLARIRADIVRCRVAFTLGQHSTLRALCHKNNGCCAMYGFEHLGALFSSLERVSLTDIAKDKAQMNALVALERYANHLEVTYR